MMADTLGASLRKQVSYLSHCPPWGKAEADLRIDSRVASSMRCTLWINLSSNQQYRVMRSSPLVRGI